MKQIFTLLLAFTAIFANAHDGANRSAQSYERIKTLTQTPNEDGAYQLNRVILDGMENDYAFKKTVKKGRNTVFIYESASITKAPKNVKPADVLTFSYDAEFRLKTIRGDKQTVTSIMASFFLEGTHTAKQVAENYKLQKLNDRKNTVYFQAFASRGYWIIGRVL